MSTTYAISLINPDGFQRIIEVTGADPRDALANAKAAGELDVERCEYVASITEVAA